MEFSDGVSPWQEGQQYNANIGPYSQYNHGKGKNGRVGLILCLGLLAISTAPIFIGQAIVAARVRLMGLTLVSRGG